MIRYNGYTHRIEIIPDFGKRGAAMEGKRLIKELRLQNFLSYGSAGQEIKLEPLNVLIGTNASGKSNIIEALGLLQATPADLTRPIREGGGISDWLWKAGS